MRRLNSQMTRCRISTGIDSTISLTCSLALGRHDYYGDERNMCRKTLENLSWDSLDILTFGRVCAHARWSTGTDIEDGNGVVEGSFSRETDLAEVKFLLAPAFTRSESLTFLSLGLHERLNQEKIPATISPMKDQVKEIIVSIPVEILRHVIGELSRRI